MFNIGAKTTKLVKAKDVEVKQIERIKCSMLHINNFFGDGIVPGLVFTLSAKRGTGKTRFLLQVLEDFQQTNPNLKCAYLSNEETQEQLALTCKNIGVENIEIAHVNDIDELCEIVKEYNFVVVDSFQGITSKEKLKEIEYINRLVKYAKENNTILGVIVHRTKDGKEKGNSGVAHEVDMCVHMDRSNPAYWGENEKCKEVIIYSDKNRTGPEGFIIGEMTSGVYTFSPIDFFFKNFEKDMIV